VCGGVGICGENIIGRKGFCIKLLFYKGGDSDDDDGNAPKGTPVGEEKNGD
jgi:hypothetical protein